MENIQFAPASPRQIRFLEAQGKKWTDNPMFDLWPSVMEVEAAKKVFLERVAHYSQFDDMSRNTLMACALAEVWRQGRRYQRDRDDAALAELAGMGQTQRAVTEDIP